MNRISLKYATNQSDMKDFLKSFCFLLMKKETAQISFLYEHQSFYLSGTQRGVVSIFQAFILGTQSIFDRLIACSLSRNPSNR